MDSRRGRATFDLLDFSSERIGALFLLQVLPSGQMVRVVAQTSDLRLPMLATGVIS